MSSEVYAYDSLGDEINIHPFGVEYLSGLLGELVEVRYRADSAPSAQERKRARDRAIHLVDRQIPDFMLDQRIMRISDGSFEIRLEYSPKVCVPPTRRKELHEWLELRGYSESSRQIREAPTKNKRRKAESSILGPLIGKHWDDDVFGEGGPFGITREYVARVKKTPKKYLVP